MMHRELPNAEWDKLDGLDIESFQHPLMQPISKTLVVEDGMQIVGHWGLVHLWHAEGLWIHPDHRGNPVVARHLLTGLRNMVRDVHASVLYTGAARGAAGDTTRRLLEHAQAVPVPMDPYFWPIRPRQKE